MFSSIFVETNFSLSYSRNIFFFWFFSVYLLLLSCILNTLVKCFGCFGGNGVIEDIEYYRGEKCFCTHRWKVASCNGHSSFVFILLFFFDIIHLMFPLQLAQGRPSFRELEPAIGVLWLGQHCWGCQGLFWWTRWLFVVFVFGLWCMSCNWGVGGLLQMWVSLLATLDLVWSLQTNGLSKK